MIRGGHRTGRVADHTCCYGDTWYIMLNEEEMKKTLGKYSMSYAALSIVILVHQNLNSRIYMLYYM